MPQQLLAVPVKVRLSRYWHDLHDELETVSYSKREKGMVDG